MESVVVSNEMSWHFQQAENAPKHHPSISNSDADFPFWWMALRFLTSRCWVKGSFLADFFLSLFFLLTSPRKNQFLHINSSYSFLELRVCLEDVYWDVIRQTQCQAAQEKVNFLLKIAILKAAHIWLPSSIGTEVHVSSCWVIYQQAK